jgi:hypothetical protein
MSLILEVASKVSSQASKGIRLGALGLLVEVWAGMGMGCRDE